MHGNDVDYINDFVALLECDVRCQEFLEKVRWPNGFVCPKCSSNRAYRMPEYALTQCGSCRYQVSATAQTIFHASHVPLRKWFLAILLMVTDKGGTSALRLHKLLEVSYKTALLMLRKLRLVMGRCNSAAIMNAIKFGTEKILHSKNKEPVQALFMTKKEENSLDRVYLIAKHGDVHSQNNQCVESEREENLRPLIAGAVALVKQFFLGTYHRASKKYLQLYLDEFTYRFNRQDPRVTLRMFISDCVSTFRQSFL